MTVMLNTQIYESYERYIDIRNYPNEEWTDIKDFEGLYQISSYGRVKSLPKSGKGNNANPRILAIRVRHHGYNQTCLTKNKKQYYFYVHRIVAEHFVKGVNENFDVNHIDGDKLNNNISNLEWISHRDNIMHAWNSNLMENIRKAPPTHFGYNCELLRLSDNKVFKFKSQKELSEFLGKNREWLGGAITQGVDYNKVIEEEGYRITKLNIKRMKEKYKLITDNTEYKFTTLGDMMRFLGKTTGWWNYSKSVNKLESDLLSMGYKFERIS